MKRFIKNVIILTIIVVTGFCSTSLFDYYVVGSQYKYNYQASLVDKINRLESINEPKIILVGHSNLSFGIDSKRIEDACGMPVVNLGLHGGLGNAFHEGIAKLNINEGDIVVVCHSTFDDTDEISDRALAWITVDNNSKIWSIIRSKDYPAMLQAYPDYLRKSLILWLTRKGNKYAGGCYSRNAFNEYGDVVYKPADGQMDVDAYFSVKEVTIPGIDSICVDRLNEYNKYIEERSASMVVAAYPIAYGEYSTFKESDFVVFKNDLQNALDCCVISDYTDYFYPYHYFYNTNLHLTKEGTEVRTEQLIADLKEWMNN